MVTSVQVEHISDLVRRHARVLRGEDYPLLRRIKALVRAREANVPERFLLPFSSALHRLIDASKFDPAAIPVSVGSLFLANRRCLERNLAQLEGMAALVRGEGAAPESSVLTGDWGALAGVYGDPGAFLATHWGLLLPGGAYLTEKTREELPPPEEEWSERVELGRSVWRRPKPPFLLALLAAHLGNPQASPTPSLWPHLGLGLLLWRDTVRVGEVLDLGMRLNLLENVEHGLAIATHVFPELRTWGDSDQLRIPSWEKKFAIPLAARRLMQGERD